MTMIKNIYIGCIGLLLATSTTAQVKIDRSKAPEAGLAPKININEPATFTLENGLKVFVIENHKLPKVSFQLSVDVPLILEGDKIGLSEMAGDMLGAGTTTKSKSEIDAEIDFIGASLATNSKGIYASGLSKHTDKIMTLMSEIMLSPAFPVEELEKKKKRAISGLKTVGSNADAIAGQVASVLNYGVDHPYGEVQTKENVENISIDDCKKYYDTYFRPNISYLVILGDIDVKRAKEMTNTYFGTWKSKEVAVETYNPAIAPKGVRVVFVEKPGAVHSVI
ncbi:MAG: zinc protease [Flavobacteriales bacterium]|jgi:zinc protease